jgi:hypothetical protein
MQFFVGVAKQFPPVPPDIMMTETCGDKLAPANPSPTFSCRGVAVPGSSEPARSFRLIVTLGGTRPLPPFCSQPSSAACGRVEASRELGDCMDMRDVTDRLQSV